MISVKYLAHDAYGKRGVEHFIEKYGLPMGYDGKKLKYELEGVKGSFVIEVAAGEMQKEVCGFLGSRVPIFEFPSETPSGKPVLDFSKDGGSYPCVSHSGKNARIGFDVFSEVGHLLSGHTEGLRGTADYSTISTFPIADYYEKVLFDSLLFAGKKLGAPIVRKSFWPEGKEFAVCLTHDVDEVRKKYQYMTRSLKSIYKMDLRALRGQVLSLAGRLGGKEPYWDCLENLLEIEKRYGASSTFFFLNEGAEVKVFEPGSWRHYGRKFDIRAPYIVEKMRELEENGWEIGVHGSYYSYNDGKMLKREKDELDGLLGAKTTGTRQHCLNLKVPDTFIFQYKAGFEYDSTLGCNESPCFRWGTCLPFAIIESRKVKELPVLEIPMIIEDTALHRAKKDTWKECARLIDITRSYNGVLTLLWHHAVFDENEYPGWAQEYERILKVCKGQDAWITNGRNIYRWWSYRKSVKPSLSMDEGKLEIAQNSKNTYYMDIFTPDSTVRRFLKLKGNVRLEL